MNASTTTRYGVNVNAWSGLLEEATTASEKIAEVCFCRSIGVHPGKLRKVQFETLTALFRLEFSLTCIHMHPATAVEFRLADNGLIIVNRLLRLINHDSTITDLEAKNTSDYWLKALRDGERPDWSSIRYPFD